MLQDPCANTEQEMEIWRFDGEENAPARQAHVMTHEKSSGSIYFNQQTLRRLVNILFALGSHLFGTETDCTTVAHFRGTGKAR